MSRRKLKIELHADELDQKSKALLALLKTAALKNGIQLDKKMIFDGLDLLEKLLTDLKQLEN